MIRIELGDSEEAELHRLRLSRRSNIGERAYYVLLSSQGYTAPSIAKTLNRNVITIRLWLRRYSEQGLSGLVSKKQTRRPAHKAKVIESRLKELLDKTPRDYGYQEAGWQINLLRDWFSRQGCDACENTIVAALKKLGYVYKRFSKTLPKNAPSAREKQAAITKMVETLSENSVKDVEVLFVDESHFSNQPYVCRGWFKKGEKNSEYRKKQIE